MWKAPHTHPLKDRSNLSFAGDRLARLIERRFTEGVIPKDRSDEKSAFAVKR
jgi:hypothetical protein